MPLPNYQDVPGIMTVSCPSCLAQPNVRCKPLNGNPTTRAQRPHAARIRDVKARAEQESKR